MALPGGGYQGSNFGKQNLDTFIPEIWSQEVKRELDNNLIMRDNIRINPVQFARKGDTVRIPEVYRLAVNDKQYNTPVTLQNQTSGEYIMTVDKYKEVSFMIEDVATLFIPGESRVRSEYTREAGYALARDIDNFFLGMRAAIFNDGDQHIYATSNGSATGNFGAIDEASILAAIQKLDEANVPREGRCLLVSPGQHTDLLTIDRFSNADYVNHKPVTNGIIGTIYGVPVKTSTQLGVNSLTGYTNGKNGVAQPTPGVVGSPYLPTQEVFTGLPYVGDGIHTGSAPGGIVTAMLLAPEWAYASIVMEPKVESSREVLYQADAVVTTQLYGAKTYRRDHAVLIHSAA